MNIAYVWYQFSISLPTSNIELKRSVDILDMTVRINLPTSNIELKR